MISLMIFIYLYNLNLSVNKKIWKSKLKQHCRTKHMMAATPGFVPRVGMRVEVVGKGLIGEFLKYIVMFVSFCGSFLTGMQHEVWVLIFRLPSGN